MGAAKSVWLLMAFISFCHAPATQSHTSLMADISFRIDRSVFKLAAYEEAAVRQALQDFNTSRQVAGLDPRLNPELISPEKTLAFLAYLRTHPGDVGMLHQKTVYLPAADLLLGEGTGVTAADLAAGFTLTLPDDTATLVMPILHPVGYDASYCQTLSQQAHLAFEAAHQRCQALETQTAALPDTDPGYRPALDALSLAKYHRFATARIWYLNQRLVVQAHPEDATAVATLREAEAATQLYVAPPRTGMR
ncbi:MAG: hypothetical protein SF053_16180 [Bacteroidia bacterium]|nr:hypothetical protein [Bacteroidia bacterium]